MDINNIPQLVLTKYTDTTQRPFFTEVTDKNGNWIAYNTRPSVAWNNFVKLKALSTATHNVFIGETLQEQKLFKAPK